MSKNNDFPDFSGKCISMSLIDDSTNHDLVDPHFEVQGGRLFIIGTVPKGATFSDWDAGCISGVAWDRVSGYSLFDSLKHFSSAIKKSESLNKKKRKKK